MGNVFLSDQLDPEAQQLANRAYLHERESDTEGLKEIRSQAYQEEDHTDSRLHTSIAGILFNNPLMVAAGWDKFGEAVTGLHTLGFAAIEVGTVPENPQPGNPQPRHFVLGPGVTLNRYGFNSPGAEVVHQNLQRYRDSGIPIGINVGRNKDVQPEDAAENHANAVRILHEDASYFTLGVSSPNTVGVRDQQAKHSLLEIIEAVQEVNKNTSHPKPIFVKIAPDLSQSQIVDVIEVITQTGLAGIVAVNSSPSPDLKAKYGQQWRDELGGLSGDDADYRDQATETIRFIYREVKGEIDVIGAGGIKDAATALEKIKAGATALQIMTALNFEGPQLPGRICVDLVSYMEKKGVKNITELVGIES